MKSGKTDSVRRMGHALACAAIAAVSLPALAQTALPGPEAYTSSRFDRSSPLEISGEVIRVDTVGDDTIIWLAARNVERSGYGSRPGHNDASGVDQIWRVEGDGASKAKGLPGLTAGATITVDGHNHADKKCEPTCRIRARTVVIE